MYAKGSNEIIDRREMLRIKFNALAIEARIIRHEETRGRRRVCAKANKQTPMPDDGAVKMLAMLLTGDTAQLKADKKTFRADFKKIHKELRLRARKYGPLEYEMHRHRTGKVRDEARHTHLALGFIKGRTYESMERGKLKADGYTPIIAKTAPDWKRVRKMIEEYGPKNFQYPLCMTGPDVVVAPAVEQREAIAA